MGMSHPRNGDRSHNGQRSHGWGGAVLGLLLAAFLIMGSVVATLGIRNMREQQAAPKPITVTTAVTRDPVSQTLSGTLHAFAHRSLTVSGEGTVTRDGIAAGTQAKEGDVIATVNERPILLLKGDVPAYRTMQPGDSGRDVKQLRAALARLGYRTLDKAGEFGPSTARAVWRLYKAYGFPAVDAAGVPLPDTEQNRERAAMPVSELVFSPIVPLIATGVCGEAGTRAQGALCTLETVERDYAVAFDAADVNGLDSKDALNNHAARALFAEPLDGKITASYTPPQVGSEGDGNEAAGAEENGQSTVRTNKVWYGFAASEPGKLPVEPDDAKVTLTIRQSAEGSYSVDSAALRGGDGDWWLADEQGERTPVTLGFCHEGRCEITGDGLREGMKAVIPE